MKSTTPQDRDGIRGKLIREIGDRLSKIPSGRTCFAMITYEPKLSPELLQSTLQDQE